MADDIRTLAARWFDDIWNRRREETIDELMAPDVAGHMEGEELHGPAAFKAIRAKLLGAMPDLHITVEDIVAAGDDAVARWHVTATHRGDQLGIPASHRAVAFRGMTWLRFREGKIVEGWDAWNQGALIQTLLQPMPAVLRPRRTCRVTSPFFVA
jgi:steroid delta-isomerase-like uncharacterized protein